MIRSLTAALLLAVWTASATMQTPLEAKRVADATTVLEEIMAAPDKGVPLSIMEKAEAVAVFPGLLRAGFVLGGQRGRGILSARDKKNGGWSSPAFLTITGGSIGAQIGAQSIDLVLIINDARGLEQLVKNQFKLGADASATAGPVGRDASAATDIQMRAQILSYSRSRGLFAGVMLNGSTIRQDRDANERFYGTAYRTGQIVFDGLAGAPDPVAAWKAALMKYGR